MSRDSGIRVRDTVAGTTADVTAPVGAIPDGYHEWPSISEDGQLVHFESYATNLVANDANGVPDWFLYIAPSIADLSLTLAASTLQPALNTDVTFTVTVTNSGPVTASGVAVRAALPPGVTYVSDTGGGDYSSGAGTWTIATLAAGSTASLQIVGHFTASAVVPASAEVIASSLPDPDSTPGNNAAAEDDQKTLVLTPFLADLALRLQASTAQPAVNSNVTLTTTVENAGPLSASGVAARIQLPAGLTFVSASPAAGYSAASGVWTLGPVTSGSIRTLTIVARITSAAPIDVIAEVIASSHPDPDSIPNNSNPADDDQQAVRFTPIVTGIVVNHPGAQINGNDGFCTLREAIIAANIDLPSGVPIGECAAGNGPDVIHMRAVPNVHTHVIVDNSVYGPTALPVVRSAIVIEGNGATIERSSAIAPLFRLFAVAPGASLTVRDVTVRGGRSLQCGGGFVVVNATLALLRTIVSNNSAAYGAGICAISPVLTLTESSVSVNSAVTNPTSTMASGGGIYIASGNALLTNTTIAGNVANATQRALGGGIHAEQGARLSLSTAASKITGCNSLERRCGCAGGGGIWAESPPGASSTNVDLTRTVVVGNSVAGGNSGGQFAYGGGLRLWNAGATLRDSTIQGNLAMAGAGMAVLGGGVLSMTGGAIDAEYLHWLMVDGWRRRRPADRSNQRRGSEWSPRAATTGHRASAMAAGFSTAAVSSWSAAAEKQYGAERRRPGQRQHRPQGRARDAHECHDRGQYRDIVWRRHLHRESARSHDRRADDRRRKNPGQSGKAGRRHLHRSEFRRQARRQRAGHSQHRARQRRRD